MNDALKGLFSLDHNIKLYIPSTVEANKATDNTKQVNDTLAKFSQWFGGATANKAVGAWNSDKVGLVTERVTIVESYCSADQVEQYIGLVVAHGQHLKRTMSQEAISLEYDNKLYFI